MPKARTARAEPAPWTAEKAAQLQAARETQVWLLVDLTEAAALSDGQVPEAVAQQADRALDEVLVEPRAGERGDPT